MRLLDLLSSGRHGVQDLASALDITNAACSPTVTLRPEIKRDVEASILCRDLSSGTQNEKVLP